MGKFVTKTAGSGEYYFSLRADNSQNILASEGYTSKAGCKNGIESVRVNSQDDSKFEKLLSTNGKHYFNLKASNGKIIGRSQMYESVSGRDIGIASVKNNAPQAGVEDE